MFVCLLIVFCIFVCFSVCMFTAGPSSSSKRPSPPVGPLEEPRLPAHQRHGLCHCALCFVTFCGELHCVQTQAKLRYRKRVKLHHAEPRSSTFGALVEAVGSGLHNLSTSVDFARANIADGLRQADVSSFAGLGGNHAQNQEREFHQWLSSSGFLQPYFIKMKLLDRNSIEPAEVSVPVLLPHEVIHTVFACGHEHFNQCFSGSMHDTSQFWDHVKQFDEWSQHSVLTTRCEQVLPLILHVDGAAMFTNQEYHVWTFSCPFAAGDLHDTKHLICTLPEESICTDAIRRHVNETLAGVLAWSFNICKTGRMPDRGYYGEELKRRGYSGAMAGPWRATYFAFNHDAKASLFLCLFLC